MKKQRYQLETTISEVMDTERERLRDRGKGTEGER